MSTKPWPPLQKGDVIQIIAPASKPPSTLLGTPDYWQQINSELTLIKQFFQGWGLQVKISAQLLADGLTFPSLANSDELRFADFRDAVFDAEVKAIMCLRGGYGSIRLLERLRTLPPPQNFTSKNIYWL